MDPCALQKNTVSPPSFVGSPKPSGVGHGVEYDKSAFTLHVNSRIPFAIHAEVPNPAMKIPVRSSKRSKPRSRHALPTATRYRLSPHVPRTLRAAIRLTCQARWHRRKAASLHELTTHPIEKMSLFMRADHVPPQMRARRGRHEARK